MPQGDTTKARSPAAQAKRKRTTNRALQEKLQHAAKLHAGGVRLVHIAAQMGVAQSTVFGWSGRADFKRAVEAYRAQQVEMVSREIESAVGAAMAVYLQLLASKKESIRLRAARDIMELNGKFKLSLEVIDQSARDYGSSLDAIEHILRTAYEREDRDAAAQVSAESGDKGTQKPIS